MSFGIEVMEIRKEGKILLILIVILLLITSCTLEEGREELKLYPAYENIEGKKLWGYINSDGEYLIQPKYDTAYDFKNGYAPVEDNGKFGIIDLEGNLVLPIEYVSLSEIVDNYVIGMKDGDFKVFDLEEGEIPLKAKYLNISSYSNGYFIVSKKDGKGNLKFGYVNSLGEEVISPKYDLAYNFQDNRALVKKGNEFILIDEKGKEKSRLNLKEVLPLDLNGYYSYIDDIGKCGILDSSGKILLKGNYESIEEISEDYILAKKKTDKGEYLGVIDYNGEEVIPFEYKDIINLGEGFFALSKELGKLKKPIYKIRNERGELLKGFYYNVGGKKGSKSLNLISVTNGEETFFIDEKGKKREDYPILTGYGELEYDGEIIRAFVNDELFYYNLEGEIVWEADRTFILSEDRQVLEKEKLEDKKISIKYPLLVGFEDREVQGKLNEFLEEAFIFKDYKGEELNKDEYEYYKVNYKVEKLEDILLIEKSTRFFLKGDSEGDIAKEVYNLDLIDGTVYRLKDIFKEDIDFIDRLNEEIELSTDNLDFKGEGIFKRIKDTDSFKIRDNNLILYLRFDKEKKDVKGYEEVHINLDKLKDILNVENKLLK